MANISVNNLTYKVNDKDILTDINLDVKEGSFISVIGTNRSGKTTLLKIIAGIIKTDQKVTINHGYLNLKNSYEDILKLGISFNNFNEYLFDDVYHELTFSLENLNISKNLQQRKILELTSFLEIEELLDKKCRDLTNEEKQLVNILLALIHEPEILILDNPFSMMKTSLKKKIIDKLKKLQKDKKIIIILSSSNLEDIILTDYTYVLDNGQIVIEGETLEVLKNDSLLKNIGLELPFSINLSLMLKFYEVYDNLEIDYNEVINKLWN